MLVDSHCHLHDKQFFDLSKTDENLAHMHENGVDKCIVIGTDPLDSAAACEFANQHPEVWWTFGYHPNDYDGDTAKLEADLTAAKALLGDKRLVAIGEIGLDYHFDGYNRDFQRDLLEHMLQIAQDGKLPVSFHIREAFDDFWPIYHNFHLPTSVLHSYSDSKKNMKIGLEEGFYFGVNGLATYADLAHPPLEKIILETDAPFLTPKPFRGIMNKPGYIKNIAEWAAEYYQVDFDEVARITTSNVEKLFHI